MNPLILTVLLSLPASGAYALPAPGAENKNAEVQETTQNVFDLLSASMRGIERDGKETLAKKLEIVKMVRKEAGEETILRVELGTELEKAQMAIQYLGAVRSADEPDAAARLEALKRIEKTLRTLVDPAAFRLLREKTESGRVKGALAALRSGLQIFYGDTEGTYPKDLAELMLEGKYLVAIPEITPPGHTAKSNAVKLVSGVHSMEELLKQVDDAGGWLYVNDKASEMWGTLLINCSHPDVYGEKAPMYTY